MVDRSRERKVDRYIQTKLWSQKDCHIGLQRYIAVLELTEINRLK